MANTFWNVCPRYTPGSPAALYSRSRDQVRRVIEEEKRSYEHALSGIFGERLKARAERLGLRGIVVLMVERRKHWDCLDEITEEHFERPFDERMRKDGFVRFRELPEHLRELIESVEPIVAAEAQQDSRPYWFRVPSIAEFWNPQGGYDSPVKPEKLLWEPTIKRAEA